MVIGFHFLAKMRSLSESSKNLYNSSGGNCEILMVGDENGSFRDEKKP